MRGNIFIWYLVSNIKTLQKIVTLKGNFTNSKAFLLTFFTLHILVSSLNGMQPKQTNTETNSKNIQYGTNAKVSRNCIPVPSRDDDERGLGDILMDINLNEIGMPNGGYANGGLTWDGTYLYIVNQNDSNVYIIDPTIPSIVGSWHTSLNGPWGVGHDESNLWITEINSPWGAYEFTYSGSPTGNSFSSLIGGAYWMADVSEWADSGAIWILAVGGTNKAYKFSTVTGLPLDSIGDSIWTYTSQRALTYDPWNEKFWVGGWNSQMIWEINLDGTPTGRYFPFSDPASLAYDWHSELHPRPVLWLATNDSIDHIYMIETENAGISEDIVEIKPLGFELFQNFPNPVKYGKTAISYSPTNNGYVNLKIYDSAGKLVRTLIPTSKEKAGKKTVYWNCLNDNHDYVSSGIYFYKLITGNGSLTKKMIVIGR
jgi:hypothetical protein